MKSLWTKLKTTLEMIKFEHTLFALPFAFLGAVLAADGLPTWRQILWITVAMFGARSAAMTFNRIIDREFDANNPRTANRELPSGKLSVGFAWGFLLFSEFCTFDSRLGARDFADSRVDRCQRIARFGSSDSDLFDGDDVDGGFRHYVRLSGFRV